MASITYTSTNFSAVHKFLHDNGISSTFTATNFVIHHEGNGNQIVALLGTFVVDTFGQVTVT